MAFKTLFMALAPDAEQEKHRSFIDTGKYQLSTVIVKNQAEAVSVAKEVYKKEGISTIMLCPGFTHADVAALFQALNGKVGVTIARGDGPSSAIALPALQKAFGG